MCIRECVEGGLNRFPGGVGLEMHRGAEPAAGEKSPPLSRCGTRCCLLPPVQIRSEMAGRQPREPALGCAPSATRRAAASARAGSACRGSARCGDQLVQLERAADERPHVLRACQVLQKLHEVQQLSVGVVVVPRLYRDAVGQLEPKRLNRGGAAVRACGVVSHWVRRRTGVCA